MQTIPRTTPTTIQVCSGFLIETAITHDNFDGEPWPPEGGNWHCVRCLEGWRHEWRRITLVEGD